jgi:methyltransferase (TIGR00027 family)
MNEARPSSTAIGAAVFRAAHRILDADPKILDDGLASVLAGLEGEPAVLAAFDRIRESFVRRAGADFTEILLKYLRASIVLRNRYAEDELESAVAHGTTQYVLLGAGLDSFAYRRPDVAARIRVFEVDLPATQQWKRQRLAELDIAVPDTVRFVPLDFERQPLLETLQASGFAPSSPAFFSWLGVTGYLTETAIVQTLAQVARACAGSEIVFSYALPERFDDERAKLIRKAIRAEIADRNEPAANSGFEPQALAEKIRSLGFDDVYDFDRQSANGRYFLNRSDDLSAPALTHHMKARVAARPH